MCRLDQVNRVLESEEKGRAKDEVRGADRMVLLRYMESSTLRGPENVLSLPAMLVRREIILEVGTLPRRVVLVPVYDQAVLATRGRVRARPFQARAGSVAEGLRRSSRRSVARVADR